MECKDCGDWKPGKNGYPAPSGWCDRKSAPTMGWESCKEVE